MDVEESSESERESDDYNHIRRIIGKSQKEVDSDVSSVSFHDENIKVKVGRVVYFDIVEDDLVFIE